MKTVPVVLACLVALSLSGCAGDVLGATPPVGSRTTAPVDPSLPANVVALSPGQLGSSTPDADRSPSSDEIRAAIPLVRTEFGKIELSTTLRPFGAYYLQFAGLRGGRVAVNALCSVHRMDWRAQWITVSDGGDCYWQAVVRDGRVESFTRNGQG